MQKRCLSLSKLTLPPQGEDIMSKVAVLDTKKRVLEPCHPAVARRLLREGQAAVFKRYPFTIILKREPDDPKTADYTQLH